MILSDEEALDHRSGRRVWVGERMSANITVALMDGWSIVSYLMQCNPRGPDLENPPAAVSTLLHNQEPRLIK